MVNQQVISLYEDEGMEIPQIAEVLELDPVVVKSALTSGSRIYRDSCRNGHETIISDGEFDTLKKAALDLAYSADDERVRASMIRFLLEQRQIDKRGPTANSVPQVNIQVLQQVIGASRKRISDALNESNGGTEPNRES